MKRLTVVAVAVWWLFGAVAYADFPPARADRTPKMLIEQGEEVQRARRARCVTHEWSKPMMSLTEAGHWDKKCLSCGYDLKNVALSETEKTECEGIGGY